MAFTVTFWGTRGSIPTPGPQTRKYGGNTSCVEVNVDGNLFVCDAGTGLRELGTSLMTRGLDKIDVHLFLSHVHWDHIQGFPFFVPAYLPTTRMRIYNVVEGDLDYYQLLSGQMDSRHFPVNFKELGAQIEAAELQPGETQIEGVRVSYYAQHHPGSSYAYAFERDGFKVVYATDSEIDLTLENRDDVERDLSLPRKIPAGLVAFMRDADLVIADGQYTETEYPKKVGWGHARVTTLADLAVQARIRQLAIYHHDPMHSDAAVEAKLEDCRERVRALGGETLVFGAREGLELLID